MNKKLSSQMADNVKNSLSNFKNGVVKFFEEYDLASLPAFFIFMVVISAGLTVNFFYLAPIVGNIEAAAISLMFEVGIGAWKLQSHRIKNSEAQAEVVNYVIWLSVGLAFAMLVSSLTQRFSWGWIVALAALTHVVGFLLFDQNDVIRNNKRKNRMAMENINQKDISSDNAILEAEADLKIIHKITNELDRLQREYKHLPVEQLEFVLEETRTRLLKEYRASATVDNATKGKADINKDGVIGKAFTVRSYAKDTEKADFQKGRD